MVFVVVSDLVLFCSLLWSLDVKMMDYGFALPLWRPLMVRYTIGNRSIGSHSLHICLIPYMVIPINATSVTARNINNTRLACTTEAGSSSSSQRAHKISVTVALTENTFERAIASPVKP